VSESGDTPVTKKFTMRVVIEERVFEGLGTSKKLAKQAVLRIRIHMFLGLLDPDPSARGMDPDPDPPDPHVFGPPRSGSISQRYGSYGSGSGSESFYHQAKKSKKNLDSYYFVTSF
jgi:hypothetical protein